MTTRLFPALVAAAMLAAVPSAQAASVYLSPASSSAPLSAGLVTLELFMDFTGDPTVGGGIDLDLSGNLAVLEFRPSTYFLTAVDSSFSGFGSAAADADFEVHFGNFAGLSGLNKLGDLDVSLLSAGLGTIAMNINSFYGDFYSSGPGGAIQSVTLTGAEVNVVPLPASAWMLLTGVAALAGRQVRRRKVA